MDINALTVGQVKELQNLINLGGASSQVSSNPLIGQYVVVRTYSAGVFAGVLKQRNGNKILLENSRMLWRWHTANNGASLSDVAVHGINEENSKITSVVPGVREIEDIDIIPCTDIARKSIEGAKTYVS